MPVYRFKAVSPAGDVSTGTLQASSRDDAIAQLQAGGQIPIRAEEQRGAGLAALLQQGSRPGSAKSAKVAAGIVRQLETLLRAGVPLDRALDILHGQAGSKIEAAALHTLLGKVRGGRSLADAMAEDSLFPSFCVGFVRAGEVGGVLETTLGRLADQMERSLKAREKVQSAMMYPAIVAIACLLSVAFLFSFVIPRFQAFFADSQAPIPAVTAAVLWIGQVMDRHGAEIAIALGATLLVVLRLLRHPPLRRRWAALAIRVPLLGPLLTKAEVGQFCRVLGTLLKNGVPLSAALDVACDSLRNPVLRTAVTDAAASVREGQGLAESLQPSRVFPSLALRLLRVGEEAARMDDMLLETAEVFDRETERDVQRMVSILGPAMTIGLGAVVALVVGSILVALLGVYQLTTF